MASITNIYEKLIKPILKKDNSIDAECLTNLSLGILAFCSKNKDWKIISNLLKDISEEFCIKNEKLKQEIYGINFPNPIGLAAGFDKNGIAANIWKELGFGFSELGTVTKYAQPGNPKPRLFRIANEQAALNRMGFNNNGADNLLQNLVKQNIQKRDARKQNCLGINFGKSKITPISHATDDYL